MSKTPTQRTLQALRDEGCSCVIVEKWNKFGGRKGGFGIRQDMFGIIDIIALDHVKGVRGVQSTGTGFAAHHKDLITLQSKKEACVDWLLTPGTTLELWGWRKVAKSKGSKVKVYKPRVKVYKLEDFLTKVEIRKAKKAKAVEEQPTGGWFMDNDVF